MLIYRNPVSFFRKKRIPPQKPFPVATLTLMASCCHQQCLRIKISQGMQAIQTLAHTLGGWAVYEPLMNSGGDKKQVRWSQPKFGQAQNKQNHHLLKVGLVKHFFGEGYRRTKIDGTTHMHLDCTSLLAIRHVFQGWVVFGGRLKGHLLPGPAQLTRVCGNEHHRCSSYW